MVKLTGASILLLGLAVVGYGIYLLTEQSGGVTYFVLAVGVYASLCGAMGLILSCKSSPWCTTRIYVILLMVAALFQLSVAVSLKVDKTWTERTFDQDACSGSGCDPDTNKWIDDHASRVFWLLLISAAAEFFASLLACCYSATHYVEEYDPEYCEYGHTDSRCSSLSQSGTRARLEEPLTRDYNPAVHQTGMHQNYIDGLREKYGIPKRDSTDVASTQARLSAVQNAVN